LARWQADWVADQLRLYGSHSELVLLTSDGDQNLAAIDGSQAVGLFTKSIQRAVIDGRADVAVHSLKDLPTQIDVGLVLAAVPTRADVVDCLISSGNETLDSLKEGARVGTGSRRRAAQLLAYRSDLRILPIRGNVQSRLDKLNSGEYDAIVLAKAGLERLQMHHLASQPLPLNIMLPAAGQGALGLEVRHDDSDHKTVVQQLNCPMTHGCVAAERQILRRLKAGCLAPVATLARVDDNRIRVDAVVLAVDGSERIEVSTDASWDADRPIECGEAIGDRVALDLKQQGAGPLIDAAR
jgi:hydroxymethylbilane synthase